MGSKRKRQREEEEEEEEEEEDGGDGGVVRDGHAEDRAREPEEEEVMKKKKHKKHKKHKKKMKKKRKEEMAEGEKGIGSGVSTSTEVDGGGKARAAEEEAEAEAEEKEEVEYPFPVDRMDHCETPLEAYEDIAPLLRHLAEQIGKPPSSSSGGNASGGFVVYDPYYCEGGVRGRLRSVLGFGTVYNRCEDFYARISAGTVPRYDVLVTNPPYSGNHLPRLLRFVAGTDKPWALLLPNFVYNKDYFAPSLGDACLPAFLVPNQGRRYQYLTVKGRHQQKSAKRTSPFKSFWYIHGGTRDMTRAIMTWLRANIPQAAVDEPGGPGIEAVKSKANKAWEKRQRQQQRARQQQQGETEAEAEAVADPDAATEDASEDQGGGDADDAESLLARVAGRCVFALNPGRLPIHVLDDNDPRYKRYRNAMKRAKRQGKPHSSHAQQRPQQQQYPRRPGRGRGFPQRGGRGSKNF